MYLKIQLIIVKYKIKIDKITDTLKDIEKNKDIANNIIFTNINIDSILTTDFNNINNFTDFINTKLDTKLSYINILHIYKLDTNKLDTRY